MSEKPTPRSKFNFEFPPNAPPLSSATSSTQPSSAEGNQDVEDLKMSQNPTPRRSIFNLDFPPNAPPLSSATSSTQPTTAEGTSKSGNYSSIANPFVSSKPTTGTSVFGAPPASGTDTSTQPESLIKGPFSVPGPDGICTSSYFTIEPEASDSFVKSFLSGTLPGFPLGGATKPTTDTSASDVTPLFGAATSTQPPTGSGFFKSGTSTASPFGVSKPTTGTSASDAPPLFGAAPSTQPTGRGLGLRQRTLGTAYVAFNPLLDTEMAVVSGTLKRFTLNHKCITCMEEYQDKSLEELRLEDYVAGRKGSTRGVFGGVKPQTEKKLLFGNTSFGQPVTTASLFGGGALGGGGGFAQQNFSSANNAQSTATTGLFGASKPAPVPTPTTGSFNSGTSSSTASPFGGLKPTTGTSLFGDPPASGTATTTQRPTGGAFGQPATTSVSSELGGGALGGGAGFTKPNYGFGNNTQSSTTTGLLGANKPAHGPTPTTAFGQPATTSVSSELGGGALGGGAGFTKLNFGFGNNTQSSTTTGLLGANKPAPGPTPTTAFGQPATTSVSSELGGGALGGGAGFTKLNFRFGNNTQSSTTTGLLGGNKPAPGPTPTTAFGQPATTSVSSELGGGALGGGAGFTKLNFGFGNDTQSSTTTGLLGGNKPAPGPTLTTGNLNNTALDAMQDLRNELKKFQENLLAAVRSEFQLLRDDLSKMDLVTHDTVPKQLSQTSDTVPKQPPRSRSPKLD